MRRTGRIPQRQSVYFVPAEHVQLLFSVGPWFLGIALVLFTGTVHPAHAQDQNRPVIEPRTREASIHILRGRDIVQPPSLWYQEGDEAPDSLGVLRVPCCPGDPDAITYRDAQLRFPVNLQAATFIRDGQIAELPISEEVLSGATRGRIYIRPPAEDYHDIADPAGVTPIRQVPGEETVIDVREWYEAALRNPHTEDVLDERFHTIRELRGRLRSTVPGGESVNFIIVATRRASRPVVTLTPLPREEIVIPETRVVIELESRPGQRKSPGIEWTTTTALLVGPNRASIPANDRESYTANRIKGDVRSALRWHVGEAASYEITLFGSTQATLSDGGSHHDVPYGLALAARFGAEQALDLRAEAQYEDDPFQAQSFRTGDQRLRLLAGYDYRTPDWEWRISAGPTYYRDQPSSWENERSDARELGVTAASYLDHRLHTGRLVSLLSASALINQSWGYVGDAGNRNTTVESRLAFKPILRAGSLHLALGPVAYFSYANNEYAEIEGFSERNTQLGVELTTRVGF